MTKDKKLIIAFSSLTILMIGLAIVGGFLNYSPVQFWDTWDGAINFFMNTKDGDISIWWAQHNEHRIILARILFWADIKWFGGIGWFLIIINYLLLSMIALVFWKILRNISTTKKPEIGEILLGLFITTWLFQWIQHENLMWSFQGQFFLAHLLPLCAIYLLYKSISKFHSNRNFIIACIFGVASVGTMANGIITLPLMTLYALIMRQGIPRIITLVTLSISVIFLFFHNYHGVVGYSNISQSITENPLNMIYYLLVNLGSPFYQLFGGGELGQFAAIFSASVLIGSSMGLAIKYLRQPQQNALPLTLLTFILYTGGSAFCIANGRQVLGINTALTSRYSTPSLLAWAALLILYSPYILAILRAQKIKIMIPFGAMALLMIPQQFKALESDDKLIFERSVAALALELGVNDQNQIKYIEYNFSMIQTIAEKARINKLSIFDIYPFRDAREQLGKTFLQPMLPTYQGKLEQIQPIINDKRFVRISGWMFNPADKTYPKYIRILSSKSQIIGYAMTGQPRPDIADTIDKKAGLSGYCGYILADQMGATLTLQGDRPSCQMQAIVPVFPMPPFSTSQKTPSADQATVSTSNILPGNEWLGSDSFKSVIPDMHVYGSHMNNGDGDVGSISLLIKRGDKLFYRSGPTGGKQILEIVGSDMPPVVLPVATEWIQHDFSSTRLPDGEFTIKLSDNGSGCGEWSAIAVKE